MTSLIINQIFMADQPLYLDPGSGSFLFQMLIAALVGGAFAIKIFWKRISGVFKKGKPEDGSNNDDHSGDPDGQ